VKEIIDGLLLGDASLQYRGKTSKARPRFGYNCKHHDFAKWVADTLHAEGLGFGPIHPKPNGYGTGETFQVMSRCDDLLSEFWERWYPSGKKVLPPDLTLTRTIANLWYVGDGGFDSCKGYLRQIGIAAHRYSDEDRDRLAGMLADQGIKTSVRRKMIYITKRSIPYFLDWIGEPPHPCYQYKWDFSQYVSKQPKY